MFTVFAIPKSFRGHTGVIQRNAIASWTLLRPKPEIILFGDDEGTVDLATELAARSVPEVRRNDLGTPYVSDVFALAQQMASHRVLVYVNSDIILMQDFSDGVNRIGLRRFIAAGQRRDLDVTGPLGFENGWQAELLQRVKEQGSLHEPEGMDYFIFTRGALSGMPDFVIGRPAWDNWIIYHARMEGIPLIDATESITAIHQNHDYSHIKRRDGPLWEGPEARQNKMLWDWARYNFSIEDATHRLLPSGVRRERRYARWKRNYDVWPILYPRLAPLINRSRRIFSRLFLQPFRTSKS
jgi:hypothetical protein